MANFCGKCGTKLDLETGLCPKCEKEKLTVLPQCRISGRWSTAKGGLFKSLISLGHKILPLAGVGLLLIAVFFVFPKPISASVEKKQESLPTEPSENFDRENNCAAAEDRLAALAQQYGYADEIFEASYTAITETNGNESAAKCKIIIPDDASLGIVFYQIGDFDEKGQDDLLVAILKDPADTYGLRLYWELFRYDDDSEYDTDNFSMAIHPMSCKNYYFYVYDHYLIQVEEADNSGYWDNSLYYAVSNDNISIHHDSVSLVDLSSEDCFPRMLYADKDFRSTGEVFYSIQNTIEGKYVYQKRYTTNPSGTGTALSAQEESCEYMAEFLSQYVQDSVTALQPVSWEKRWNTGFFHQMEKIPEHFVIELYGRDSFKTAADTTSGDIFIRIRSTIDYRGLNEIR